MATLTKNNINRTILTFIDYLCNKGEARFKMTPLLDQLHNFDTVLTRQERVVFFECLNEFRIKDVAKQLSLSEHTVVFYLKNIARKVAEKECLGAVRLSS